MGSDLPSGSDRLSDLGPSDLGPSDLGPSDLGPSDFSGRTDSAGGAGESGVTGGDGLPRALPTRLNVRECVSRGTQFNGTYNTIGLFSRLDAAALSDVSTLDLDWTFGTNPAGYMACWGSVVVDVGLRCQRCLEPVVQRLRADAQVEFVGGEFVGGKIVDRDGNAREGSQDWEAYPDDGEPLAFAELIEDELLLVLPFAPRHEETDCAIAPDYRPDVVAEPDGERADDDGAAGTRKPFAGLAAMLDAQRGEKP